MPHFVILHNVIDLHIIGDYVDKLLHTTWNQLRFMDSQKIWRMIPFFVEKWGF